MIINNDVRYHVSDTLENFLMIGFVLQPGWCSRVFCRGLATPKD